MNTTTHEEQAGTDLWRVKLTTGEVRAMSLDALDEAFQSGLLTEATPVLPPGATAWTTLADAAGLDAASAEPVQSIAPVAMSVAEPPAPALGVDLDTLPDEAFKPKKGRVLAFVGVGLAVACGLGFGALRVANLDAKAPSSQPVATAAAAAPPPAAMDLGEAAPARVLTDEQKARLAEADKAREATAAAAAAKRAKDRPSTGGAKRTPGAAPFVNSGDKYDPMNGAL
ncbi:hypothetical protein AKJ09_11088 [Labilithrix luteola]|uniref:Uncharacterized protein n=1 Tax=Labilithrix luteola TaxID=1391654 RepID=A0A0K1QG61_9BACT|nr:hypothetical protein [Labilithrix luteola]AKV04425.1 hypothetical protein AKJ09_11088 [Labilithrix luteola]